ncbi:MAG: exodeoxyribonuclease VII small subunit [Puniceicoccales bacterium]|jgi:exodeoxyribonuclease VII small subunit|nr:exodeoxyribonuclease VII small subunit [Puniceicoccales bacterium]
MRTKKSKKTPSFEIALKKLEDSVVALEQGDVSLSDLVNRYKEGLYYQQICQEHLNRAALLLDELTSNGDVQPLQVETDKGLE